MLERPVTFNNLLAEFLHYQVSEGELEGRARAPQARQLLKTHSQVVSAPCAAEPTWRAYLPSTPVR